MNQRHGYPNSFFPRPEYDPEVFPGQPFPDLPPRPQFPGLPGDCPADGLILCTDGEYCELDEPIIEGGFFHEDVL